MPDSAEAIPRPGERPAALPALDVRPLAEAWRLHWEDDPTVERRHSTGRHRFDAPAGEFGVTYLNHDRLAVFAETYAEGTRVLGKSESQRLRSRIWSTRSLHLLRMDEMAVAAAFGLDNRISTEKPNDRTQAWSAAWHAWFPSSTASRSSGARAPRTATCACTSIAAPTRSRSRPTARSPSRGASHTITPHRWRRRVDTRGVPPRYRAAA